MCSSAYIYAWITSHGTHLTVGRLTLRVLLHWMHYLSSSRPVTSLSGLAPSPSIFLTPKSQRLGSLKMALERHERDTSLACFPFKYHSFRQFDLFAFEPGTGTHMHAHYRTNLSYQMSICARIVYILCERFKYVIWRDNDPCRPWIICLALAKLYIFNHKKESKKGRPSGPSPHVRVTQQCKATSSHLCMEPKETRQNNSRKYMGHQKECLLPVPTSFYTFHNVVCI